MCVTECSGSMGAQLSWCTLSKRARGGEAEEKRKTPPLFDYLWPGFLLQMGSSFLKAFSLSMHYGIITSDHTASRDTTGEA
mmetsp:Transcript_22249/g.56821  ORF Transcript_22249/g.56821 Transcript_22249/m.56821 type:complete len:81 (+) Transcript_22249:1472-1714(+)